MSRTLAILIIVMTCLWHVKADPVIEATQRQLTAVDDFFNALTPSSGELFTGDMYMPTLSEMLGGPVDNLGHITGNEALKEDLVAYAKKYIGSRYRSGGKSPQGFDCSGFTSFVFREFGYQLMGSSAAQGQQGERVSLEHIEVGDLMFFSGRAGGKTVGHVGMVISVDRAKGRLQFIHSSSSQGVVIQSFPDDGYYSKRFLHATRVLDDEDEADANDAMNPFAMM